jgi:hypothetical protein
MGIFQTDVDEKGWRNLSRVGVWLGVGIQPRTRVTITLAMNISKVDSCNRLIKKGKKLMK